MCPFHRSALRRELFGTCVSTAAGWCRPIPTPVRSSDPPAVFRPGSAPPPNPCIGTGHRHCREPAYFFLDVDFRAAGALAAGADFVAAGAFAAEDLAAVVRGVLAAGAAAAAGLAAAARV